MEFKRGFLNSQKGRDALGGDSEREASVSKLTRAKRVHELAQSTTSTPTKQPDLLDADEFAPPDAVVETAEKDRSGSPDEEMDTDPPSPPPVNGPAYTEVPLDLHSPPPGIGNRSPGRDRFVFSEWPRDPNGRIIRYHDHKEYGKRTSNGNRMWGETLWDFYKVHTFPDNPIVETTTSGSRIAAFMREYGELDFAASDLAWVDTEGDPKQIFPCDIGRLICDGERRKAPGSFVPIPIDSSIPLHPTPKLEARLPFNLLPEKLIVHDPWNTLSVQRLDNSQDGYSSSEKEDIVHVFELSLSEEGRKTRRAHREAARAANKARQEEEEWRKIEPSAREPGPLPPTVLAIWAKVPPRPPRPTYIPEARLYIRREDRCGDGNHSVVYFSELELPRWALVDDVLCEACWKDALATEVAERIEAKTLRPDDPTGEEKPPEIRRTVETFDDLRNATLVIEETASEERKRYHLNSNMREIVTDEYVGPIAYVYPKIEWQNPERGPVCEHLQVGGRDLPLTARVKVCAKLSIQGDLHLAQEAEHYQAFPSYFFEHWNGYNVVIPIHDPVPCSALVPQFYGYYVPQGGFEFVTNSDSACNTEPTSDTEPAPRLPAGYLSPILLLEHRGEPIGIETMSLDDKNAAAALYQTLHFGGWAQNSMHARNVVWQPGPITEWPAFRGMDERFKRFRLIDFGRAEPLGRDKFLFKNIETMQLFKLGHYAF